MYGLKLRLYQLEKLIAIYLPNIDKIMKKKEINCELFGVQWFITFFGCDFVEPYIYTIWDLFLINDWEFIFQLSLSIIKNFEICFEKLNNEKIMENIKTKIRTNETLQAKVIKHCFEFKVTQKQLFLLHKKYDRISAFNSLRKGRSQFLDLKLEGLYNKQYLNNNKDKISRNPKLTINNDPCDDLPSVPIENATVRLPFSTKPNPGNSIKRTNLSTFIQYNVAKNNCVNSKRNSKLITKAIYTPNNEKTKELIKNIKEKCFSNNKIEKLKDSIDESCNLSMTTILSNNNDVCAKIETYNTTRNKIIFIPNNKTLINLLRKRIVNKKI